MNIPKRVHERVSKSIPKFKRILKKALDKDVNESNTVQIITDMLEAIFGYDKYDEVTREYAIKGTYCDLAIKLNKKPKFLIEAKAIGIDLKENHLNQALTYGAKEGTQWIILTNGIYWKVYHVEKHPTLEAKLLLNINFLEINLRKKDTLEGLFVICREGQTKNAIDEFSEKANIVNEHVISAILTDEKVVNAVRLQLNRMSPSVKASNEEVLEILLADVIKRDVLDDDAYKKAKTRLKRLNNRAKK